MVMERTMAVWEIVGAKPAYRQGDLTMKNARILAPGLALAMSTVLLARGPNPSPAGTRIEGVIADIDSVARQIVVDGVAVQVLPDTVINMRGEELPFGDLQIGMTVAACGTVDDDLLTARRVTVKYGGRVALVRNDTAAQQIVVKISPHTLLLGADQSGSVVVHADIAYSQVDSSTVTLEGIAVRWTKADLRGELVAYFDETAMKAIVEPPNATLTLAGVTRDGTPFSGSDTVQVKQ